MQGMAREQQGLKKVEQLEAEVVDLKKWVESTEILQVTMTLCWH